MGGEERGTTLSSSVQKSASPFWTQLWFQLVVAIVAGVWAGLVLHSRAAVLGELGAVVVRLLKALATPLVFFAIVDAIARAPLTGKMGARLIAICITNTTIAALLSIGLGLLIAPGRRVDASQLVVTSTALIVRPELSTRHALEALVPDSLARPFVENQVLAVVLLALAVG
ncbi:MAG: cation:dicarboxylase symporter family transporter, partial [Polyangia bacterium]